MRLKFAEISEISAPLSTLACAPIGVLYPLADMAFSSTTEVLAIDRSTDRSGADRAASFEQHFIRQLALIRRERTDL
jgi:hypothetical protein